jgi:hypothetical protein
MYLLANIYSRSREKELYVFFLPAQDFPSFGDKVEGKNENLSTSTRSSILKNVRLS